MAKKIIKKSGVSLQGFDVNHYKQTEGYVQAVDALYNQAISEFSKISSGLNLNPDKVFSFADYPKTKAASQQILNQLASKMQAVIVSGSREQWLYACKKNDEFLGSILNTSKIPKKTLAKYQDKNLDALSAFQKRKVGGMDLSQRVWNYTGQMKTQMELGIDIAVGEGKSAAQLSRDLRKYLVDPDKLFHKVKNKHGNLVLSKNAAAFHPGQGKYRSSYKNAMRLTRTEINMAYRQSDQLRWQSLDFVVGYEVKLSNNHTLNGVPFVDICDDLKGKYPKTFKFVGWHPQCRCHVVPIMQDPDEFNEDELNELKSAVNDTEYEKYQSKNTVSDIPQGFKDWIAGNMERSQNWSSQPYFIKDNFVGGNLSGGLKIATKTAEQLAAEQLAIEKAKQAAIEASIEAQKAAKAKALLEKTTKMSGNLVAKVEKNGFAGEALDNMKAALAQEGTTNAELNSLYKKLKGDFNKSLTVIKDPLSKETLLTKYSQEEVDNLFSAYDNFYKTKINHLNYSDKVHKLTFEVDWLGKNGKYSTSGELKKLLERDLEALKLNFEKDLIKKEASDLILAHSSINDSVVKLHIKELEKIIKNDSADINAIKTAIGNANKSIVDYNAKNIRSISADDFSYFEDEKAKFSLTKHYTKDEKAKVRELREKLNNAIVTSLGNLRADAVYNAQKELTEYVYKIQFKYLHKQESIKHLALEIDKSNNFKYKYVSDTEAEQAYDRYISGKKVGGGFYSSSVGGVFEPDRYNNFVDKMKKAGVDIKYEHTLPQRYFAGSGFINGYLGKSDLGHVLANRELQESLHDYITALSHSVNKLPRHNGISYRGIGYSKDVIDDLISAKASGKPWTHVMGMSTSITPKVADNFSTGITFKIFGRSGVYGREYSNYSGELEVLYRPGSKFQVVEVYQETGYNGIAHNGKWTVVLKEVLE